MNDEIFRALCAWMAKPENPRPKLGFGRDVILSWYNPDRDNPSKTLEIRMGEGVVEACGTRNLKLPFKFEEQCTTNRCRGGWVHAKKLESVEELDLLLEWIK